MAADWSFKRFLDIMLQFHCVGVTFQTRYKLSLIKTRRIRFQESGSDNVRQFMTFYCAVTTEDCKMKPKPNHTTCCSGTICVFYNELFRSVDFELLHAWPIRNGRLHAAHAKERESDLNRIHSPVSSLSSQVVVTLFLLRSLTKKERKKERNIANDLHLQPNTYTVEEIARIMKKFLLYNRCGVVPW